MNETESHFFFFCNASRPIVPSGRFLSSSHRSFTASHVLSNAYSRDIYCAARKRHDNSQTVTGAVPSSLLSVLSQRQGRAKGRKRQTKKNRERQRRRGSGDGIATGRRWKGSAQQDGTHNQGERDNARRCERKTLKEAWRRETESL